MKKNKHIIAIIIVAITLFVGCKDDAFYGSELPGGTKTTVGFSGQDETITVINSFDGTPKFEETTLSIPVKIYSPLKEDITVKLVQNDALLDSHYNGSKFGFGSFPNGVLEAGSVTIPAGKTEAVVNISLAHADKLTSEGEYLAAFSMSIDNIKNAAVQVFGIQYHIVKAVQKRSENVAELSINKQEVAFTANNPSKATVLESEDIKFTITTSIAQDRKVILRLQNNPSVLEHFYKRETDGFLPFPQGVLEDIDIEIPAGETEVEVTLPFSHTDKLIDEAGYLAAFKLKEISEDKRYVSASDDAYFFVKIKQTTSVKIASRYSWGNFMDKTEIKAYANGSDVLLPAVLDDDVDGDFFEIKKSDNGSLELMFESSVNVRDLTLHTNIKESGITSFYVAVTKDSGQSWLPRAIVNTSGAENEFNLSFQPYSAINGIKIYGVKGAGSGLKVYEVTPYTSWW